MSWVRHIVLWVAVLVTFGWLELRASLLTIWICIAMWFVAPGEREAWLDRLYRGGPPR